MSIPADLVGTVATPAQTYQVNPQLVRNCFIDFLAKMQAAEMWPWDEGHIDTLRTRTWPHLYAKLPDQAEASDWKAKLEAGAARLDAAKAKAA